MKKYTSGIAVIRRTDLPPGQREKLMASFERVLIPRLDKDSTTFCGWNTQTEVVLS